MNPIAPKLELLVRCITYQGAGINAYELVPTDTGELPRFDAGAHIDIFLTAELTRQYSLCNDPAERHRYLICVQRESHGRGGSKTVHDSIRVGQTVSISHPRNNFALSPAAKKHQFLAGGIGITPIMAMVYAAQDAGVPWALTYCTREPAKTAFIKELAPFVDAGLVRIHHDAGQPEQAANLKEILSDYDPGTHLYYCGPTGLMSAAAQACAHWPAQNVHCEYFTVPDETAEQSAAKSAGTENPSIPGPFQVKVNSSGLTIDVSEDQSIVQALADNGIVVPTSCESGLCGTCRTDYLQGEPDHRDYILSDEEKAHSVLICCARSLTPLLVLDL